MSDKFEAGTGDAEGEASAARTRRRRGGRRSTAGGRTRSRRLIVAIDGPAGSGKSTTAKVLARRLGLPYIDTGAMYRVVTWKAMREGVDFSDKKKLVQIAKKSRIHLENTRVFLDGKDVTHIIRAPELTKNVFRVAQEPLVRREMVKKQRAMGKARGGVMEGRDIGTVVFPHADYKFFFTANESLRARRRYKELTGNSTPTFREVLRDLRKRDRSDRERSQGPLKRAKDAVLIDTTPLTIGQTVDKILAAIGK